MSAHGYLTEMFSPLSNGVYSRVPGYIGFISTIIYSAIIDLDKRNETDPMSTFFFHLAQVIDEKVMLKTNALRHPHLTHPPPPHEKQLVPKSFQI